MIYLQYMVYLQWYDGNGRKNPEKYIYTKNKEKIPRWLPSHPPVTILLIFIYLNLFDLSINPSILGYIMMKPFFLI